MGCLLERSRPHLIPGAWKSALRGASSPVQLASTFTEGRNSAKGQGWEARKERQGWYRRALPTFVAKCFVDGEIIWWKVLFLHHAFALQSLFSIIFLKITASVGKLRNGSSTLIAKHWEARTELGTASHFSNSLFLWSCDFELMQISTKSPKCTLIFTHIILPGNHRKHT